MYRYLLLRKYLPYYTLVYFIESVTLVTVVAESTLSRIISPDVIDVVQVVNDKS